MNSGPLGKDWFGDCQDVLGKMMQFCTLVWFEMILWAIAAVNIYWKGLMEWSSVGWVGAVLCLWCSKRFEKWQWLEKGGEAHENRFPVFMALLDYIMSKELGIRSFSNREELSHPAFIIFSIRNFEFCYKMEKKRTYGFSQIWLFAEIFSAKYQFSSVQSLSCVWLFSTPRITVHQASLSITNSWSLLKLMSIESVMPSSHLILCRSLLFLPSVFPSIKVFSKESVLHIRWPKYWSFSFSISPSNEYSGLISFSMDWLDLFVVQETLKSLLQHHSSKASILWCSAFFIVQLSHPYMTTGKTIAFDLMGICWQSNMSAFYYAVYVCHSFSSKEQASFKFMAAVTICSGFGSRVQ